MTEATSSNPGIPIASGDLLATDVDNTNDAFQAVGSPAASANGYGTYTISATGAWVYTLDNANAAVEALGSGDTLSDSFTVLSQDGTAQMVSITINGADDRMAPTDINLIIDSPLTDQNNMNFSVTGTLVATDADPGDFSYTLVSQTPSGGSAAIFSISDDNLLSAGNLGQNQTYTLEINATQTGDPVGMSYTESFTIITGSNANSGPNANDTLSATTGDDVLFGGAGNDILVGGSGDDTLFGHAGSDTLTVALTTIPSMVELASTTYRPLTATRS